MAQVTVGQQVLPIVPNGQHELFVTNLGPNELWYGRDGSVSAQSGQPLDPGNAVQGWPLDQTMYVVAPNGPTSVAYESNGSQVAIGAATNVVATLAPGTTVGIDGTVPVSGSVGVSGGSVGISGTAQVAGTVSVGQTFSVIGTLAAHAWANDAGYPNSATRYFAPVSAGAGTGVSPATRRGTGGLLQTLIVNVPNSATWPNNSVQELATCLVTWYTDATFTTQVMQDSCVFFNYGQLQWTLPVRSQYFTITTNPSAAVTGGNPWVATYFGSTVAMPRDYLSNTPGTGFNIPIPMTSGNTTGENNGIFTGTTGAQFTTNSNAQSVDSFLLLPSRAGQANFYLQTQSTNMQAILFCGDGIVDSYNGFGDIMFRTSGTAAAIYAPVMVTPEAPLFLALRSTSGTQAVTANIALQWEH